ncbi:peptide-methionine (R)-S-oxide reductase MsrB [Paracoccus sp. SCSIO 75233]|uniref:peptide-methionine (R)-S-oxide reductase MsrB n=1 Tax=Paracoccus sp. SCSIO 75233 TaxID=3017782 RepID=UPI0022F04B39|nr:peptide-methionine (R)-S-oxide reductase MsrB [Paracoccus sp. SCSIO 75233]WBU51782.1 peptide-methionine (R)-S-oxide reductase MsrB [Paracoccus sp. SCSIO 75233]
MANVQKSDAEWRAQLSDEEYRITRQAGTERPFSHPGFPKDAGYFACVCCGAPLFEQDAKFESHCGWPSFSAPGGKIDEHRDATHGMIRTEVRCHECDAHLGHVFPDGPPPTGLRYCINGVAIKFVPAKEG